MMTTTRCFWYYLITRRVPDCFIMSATSRQASSLADIFLHACTLLSNSTGRRSISPINCSSIESSS